MVHSLNRFMDFYPLFRVCSPQDDLGLIRFWGYPKTTAAMATLLIFWDLKFVGVLQPKPIHRLSPIFQDMFSQEDPELIRF